MAMTSRLRKFVLTAHISFSVGWLGAVAVFLAHAIIGLTSDDALLVRSAYIAMELSAWLVIVPSCIGALLTGLIQSLGTSWGLFKHYWIVVKLLLTLGSTILLLLHIGPIEYMADAVSKASLSSTDLRELRIQLVADASAALLVLLITIAISVYKPWGMTPYGFPKKHNNVILNPMKTSRKTWGLYVVLGIIALVLIIVIVHLFGGGLGNH